MSRFIYRMQNILNVKESMERQAKMQYAAANQRLRTEEEKLQQLKERKNGYESQAQELLLNQLQVRDIIDNNQAILKMDEYIKAQLIRVHVAEMNVEKARKRMTEFMQERKMHERLKEKAFEQFLEDEKHREGKEIDELTSYTYGQRVQE